MNYKCELNNVLQQVSEGLSECALFDMSMALSRIPVSQVLQSGKSSPTRDESPRDGKVLLLSVCGCT